MTTVEICPSGGLIFRKDAMRSRKITTEHILSTLETYPVLDENDAILSIGPIYPEAIDELIRRIEKLGLSYVDDFFEIKLDVPDWLKLHVSMGGSL